MYNLPVLDQIASAHAVFCGQYGDVSALARQRGVYRQSLYREAQAVAQAVDPRHHQEVQALRQRVAELEGQVQQLQQQRAQTAVLDDDLLSAFVATAQAEGVSLLTSQILLKLIFAKGVPSLATPHQPGRAGLNRPDAWPAPCWRCSIASADRAPIRWLPMNSLADASRC